MPVPARMDRYVLWGCQGRVERARQVGEVLGKAGRVPGKGWGGGSAGEDECQARAWSNREGKRGQGKGGRGTLPLTLF